MHARCAGTARAARCAARRRGECWMLRIGEASRPGPPRPAAFRLASAKITSWGSAGKCITR
eukprot:1445302-Lingulodinium_polyedra.AAC.1